MLFEPLNLNANVTERFVFFSTVGNSMNIKQNKGLKKQKHIERLNKHNGAVRTNLTLPEILGTQRLMHLRFAYKISPLVYSNVGNQFCVFFLF